MLPTKIDLRKYNITDQVTMIEFLELIVNKVPQMIRLMKKLQLENQSLRNRNSTYKDQLSELSTTTGVVPQGDNISVSDRLAGKTFGPIPSKSEQDRLAQMAAVGMGIAEQQKEEPNTTVDDLPDASANSDLLPTPPSGPGEIGNLNINRPLNTAPPLPTIPPALDPPVEGQEPPAAIDGESDEPTGEVDPSSVGDLDLGSDSLDLDDTKVQPPNEPQETIPPSDADKTPVGTRVSQGQLKDKPLKSYNRTDLNTLATDLGIKNAESYASNKHLRKAIESKQAEQSDATDN